MTKMKIIEDFKNISKVSQILKPFLKLKEILENTKIFDIKMK